MDLLIKSGEIIGYKCQVTFELRGLNGKIVTRHRIDFYVEYPDGHFEVHEVKGWPSDVWPLKKALFEDNYPDIPYRVITAADLTGF